MVSSQRWTIFIASTWLKWIWFLFGFVIRSSAGLSTGTFWLRWMCEMVGESNVTLAGVLTGFWKLCREQEHIFEV